MGLRKDLDSIKIRYIYALKIGEDVVYIGTAINPKTRYNSHLKRINTDNALIYKFLRKIKQMPKMVVLKKVVGTYADAEKEEIEMIEKYSDSVLNFYNNPNKKRYYEMLNCLI